MEPLAATVFKFGDVTWDPGARRLVVRGVPVTLPYRALSCLDELVRARGAAVTREALQSAVWEGSIVEDSNLSHCIVVLRKALDPLSTGESYIETVPRVGYRLAVPVAVVAPESSPAAGRADHRAPRSQTEADSPRRRWMRPTRWFMAVSVVAVVVAGVLTATFSSVGDGAAAGRVAELIDEGFHLLRQGNTDDGIKASGLFSRALELDPESAEARAGLAEAAARLGDPPFDAAVRLAREAVALDPACANCQAVLGYILMTRQWQWQEAGERLQSAVRLDKTAMQSQLWWAMWLAIHGRLDEAATAAAHADAISGAHFAVVAVQAQVEFLRRNYTDAVRLATQAAGLNRRHHPAYYWLTRAHMILGDDTAAAISRVLALAAWSNLSAESVHEAMRREVEVVARTGRAGIARQWIAETTTTSGEPMPAHGYNQAIWRLWTGDREEAIRALEHALIARPYNVVYAAVDPALEPIRDDPRVAAVIARIGIEVERD